MRTTAAHGSLVLPGQLGVAALAPAPSSTTRADAEGASASSSSRAGNSSRIRFMIGIATLGRAPSCAPSSLVPVGDSSPVEVVRRQLDLYPVPGQDADVVPPHLAGDVSEDFVPIVELDLEHRVWEGLDDLALHFDLLFLGHGESPQMRRTFTAFGPLSPVSSSYSTFEFSASDLKPWPSMPL